MAVCPPTPLSHERAVSSPSQDDIHLYQDIIEEVINGRPDGHACPYCGAEALDIAYDEAKLSIKCGDCGKYFRGLLR